MKKYLLLIPLLLIGGYYLTTMQEHDPIQKANTGPTMEDLNQLTGAEKFALYHSNIRKSPEGSPYAYKSGYQVEEYNKLKKRLPANPSRMLTWEERGPGNVSGRTRTVWVDPRDDSGESWFVGSAQGGVWKTEDGGATYVLKTPDVPHLGTAAIMGCQTSPEVIYAGSGEGFNFLSAAGAGIFKSEDGGETWRVLESTVNNPAFANVHRMAVHPDNPDVVFAANRTNNSINEVEGYIMRSKDGGETWEEVLAHFDIIPHILMSPDNGDVLYAGLNQEGVLKSVDGGDNWDFVWLFESPELRPERIELAISPSDPNYVYFTTPINDEDFSPGDKIFVSNNAGETFNEVIANDAKDDYSNFSGGQSFWNKAIAVHPFNPTQVYFGGQSALLRMDVTLVEGLAIGELDVISDGYGSYSEFFPVGTKGVHVDHHGITFSVTDEAEQEFIIINTNDGGVATSRDNGASFDQTGDTFLQGFNPEGGNWVTVDGYNVSTFYGADKMNGADRYVGGTQDNGSWVSPADPDATSRWSYAPSGDGFEAAWNYDNTDQIIESSQFNNLHRSDDGGETWYPLNTPGFGPFISAIANSKIDGDMVMISTSQGPALSLDFGTTWTIAETPDEYVPGFLRSPIEISLFDPSVVWIGNGVSQFNRICVSRDGGSTFTATAPYEAQMLGEVAGLATHPADVNTAYAVFGASGLPKVIRTTDGGQSWEDISGFEGSTDGTSSRGFPDVAVFSLLVMPYDNNIIWAGTEVGIVESLDNGETWNLIDDDLPATAIWEMVIVNDEVVLATHGRGIWTTSLPELEGYEPPVPFLLASKFDGDTFDKKVDGTLKYLTPIDSGMLTVTVETPDEVFTREYELGEITEPTEEEIFLNLEDFDIGDVIYNAEIEIKVFRDGEERTRKLNKLFYDVDAADIVESYNDDFDSGNFDFAIGRGVFGGADFRYNTPTGFADNGLESTHNFMFGEVYRTIFQKPIRITETGSQLSFDEIALFLPAGDFGFTESVVLEATNDKGKTWVRLAQYSAEAHENWTSAHELAQDASPDLYHKRRVVLSDYFDEGDEVYFKVELMGVGFPNSWGFIMDNLTVEGTVSTQETELAEGIAMNTLMNPFDQSTQIKVTLPDGKEVGAAALLDMNGQVVQSNEIQRQRIKEGMLYDIDGSNLASGFYLFKINVGNHVMTEKIIKI